MPQNLTPEDYLTELQSLFHKVVYQLTDELSNQISDEDEFNERFKDLNETKEQYEKYCKKLAQFIKNTKQT